MRLLEALHDSYYVPLKAAAVRANRDEDDDDDNDSSAAKSASLNHNSTPDGGSNGGGGTHQSNNPSSSDARSSPSSSPTALLSFAPHLPPPLSEADVETVFAHIPAIVALHRQLLADLTARMDDWGAAGRHASTSGSTAAPPSSSSSSSASASGSSPSTSTSSSGIGDVLLRFAPFFKIYAALVVAQEASRATLAASVQTSIPLR